MKFIYIVYYDNYEDSENAGVYLTKKEAIKRAKELNEKYGSSHDVQEWNLVEQTYDNIWPNEGED